MPSFQYKAKKKDAQTVVGEILADNKDEAVEKINQLGLVPITVEDNAKDSKEEAKIASGKVNAKQQYSFSRQLSGLLKAGVSLIKGLSIIEDQMSNPYFKNVIKQMCTDLKDGKSFSDSLSKHPTVFSSLYVAMIRAGEEGGNLAEMLLNLATYQQKQNEILSKIRTALTYPVVMLVLGICTIFFMFVFVMPQITGLFINMKERLPLPTLILMNLSDFLQVAWAWIAIMVLSLTLFLKRWFQSKKGHAAWSQFQMDTPFLKEFVLKIELARFCRTLELLLKSGISILRAMQLSIPLVANDVIREQLVQCQSDVISGSSFGKSLKNSKVIPKMISDLIGVGEESGSLTDALKDISDNYEQDTDETIKIMTTLLEPLMIVVVGAAIGFIVFSILLPVFQMDVFA